MKKWLKKIKDYALKHPIRLQIFLCLIFALAYAIPNSIISVLGMRYRPKAGDVIGTFFSSLIVVMLVIGALIYPIIVTIYEFLYLFVIAKKGKSKEVCDKAFKINGVGSMLYDFFIIVVGVFLEFSILDLLHDVVFEANWSRELRNAQLHTPLNTHYVITFAVISYLYVLGMLVITLKKKRPPLVTVLCISAMYLGVIEAILFTVQILGMHTILESGRTDYRFELDLLYTLLIPINMLLMMLRVMLVEIKSYEIDENRDSKIKSIPILSWCDKLLNNSKSWPILAILMMIPLLGIVIGILTLFGQAPDAAIKAFTETADYTFSTRIPPQNVFYDEHYLCTVAAGGHERVVKPIRMGKRHNHDVVVNRQLMIANAFEQILEERIPKVHKVIRGFYDRYGFPIAKLIKSKIVADLIWFIMKPLEWLFLIVIYLLDENPEDRIAKQYL